MSDTSTHLALPYLMASQAQKHVTMNEALRMLDGIVQLAVLDRDLTAPPANPAEGDRYIVAASATGVWAGWDGSIAYWVDGAWLRIIPSSGWLAWIEDEAQAVIWSGSAWIPMANAMGFIAQSAAVDVAAGALGSATGLASVEEAISGLSGASVTSTVEIPDRCILLGVSVRVQSAISGASSFDCGIAGEASKFGGSLGVAAGSSNIGVIGPTAFYSDTPVVLTANGGDFTGGEVVLALHYITCRAAD